MDQVQCIYLYIIKRHKKMLNEARIRIETTRNNVPIQFKLSTLNSY